MQTLSFWVRPAVFAILWILAAALTVSEVATIGPALQSASGAPPRVQVSIRANRP
ncbi:MAG TPA: hypothetical protein VE755_12105 [Myxococcales bacterium]|jgi:hypothetical protein|nr:hypothetical protein [Myxococcales bacterium]